MKTEIEWPTGNIYERLRRLSHVKNNLQEVSNNS